MLLPFYHAVTNETPLHIKHLYPPRTIDQFKQDLDFLLEHYEPIDLTELQTIVTEGSEKKNCFHLSFDDGLSEFYKEVAPILKAKGVPATVFLNGSFIDNKELFYRFKASILYEKTGDELLMDIDWNHKDELDDIAVLNNIDFNEYLLKHSPYLTTSQIKELAKDGFTFGAHSMDHPMYSELSLDQQVDQTRNSLNRVYNIVDQKIKVFSFPFTDFGVKKDFFQAIQEDVGLTFGCAGIKDESIPNHLQRVPMETVENGEDIIRNEYAAYLMKRMIGKHVVRR